jgi:tetratricopeptide repeat protein 30
MFTEKSRAALSLLAYCHYATQDFSNSAHCYDQLTRICPDDAQYKMHHAQALYQACAYEEALRVTSQVDVPELQGQVTKLRAAIKYGEEDLPGAKSLVDACPADDPDTEVNLGCLLYKVCLSHTLFNLLIFNMLSNRYITLTTFLLYLK